MNNNLENIKRIKPTFICFSDRKNIEKAFKKYCKENYIPARNDIDSFRGQIIFYNNSAFNTTLYLDTLYDLMKADLVEKVEDE